MSQEEHEVRSQGEYIRIVQQGRWEFVERCKGSGAVVRLAVHDGKVILVEQARVPLGGRRCLELPAGLVGDEDDKSVEETALKELEEETGYRPEWIEVIGHLVLIPFFILCADLEAGDHGRGKAPVEVACAACGNRI